MSQLQILSPSERERSLQEERRRHRTLKAGLGVLGVLALVLVAVWWTSAERRPSAPSLQDGPVFREAREGFRFSVPEGWKQRARANVPSGKIQSERMLTEYRCVDGFGRLMVSVADVPLSTRLSDYVAKNTLTGEEWRLRSPAQDFTINGEPAACIAYAQGGGRQQMIREIVAFRRGERVYFFKGFYAASNPKSAKAFKAAVDTIVW